VEFRLLYQGKLPAAGQSGHRPKQQVHAIRKQFHQQLQLLWQQHRGLSGFLAAAKSSPQESSRSMVELIILPHAATGLFRSSPARPAWDAVWRCCFGGAMIRPV